MQLRRMWNWFLVSRSAFSLPECQRKACIDESPVNGYEKSHLLDSKSSANR